MDWGELLEQALRHKMVPMLAHHVVSAGLRFDVPTSIYQHLESALEWNRCQIEVFRRETVRVAQALAGGAIHFVVTKGMAFESTLYCSLGTRYMNDIDFMINARFGGNSHTSNLYAPTRLQWLVGPRRDGLGGLKSSLNMRRSW